jgi:hypothetical protein
MIPFGLFGLSQIMAALKTELAVGRNRFTASGVGEFELLAALLAELEAIGQLDFAQGAFHGFPRQTVERGRTVQPLNSEDTQHDVNE